MFTKAIYVGTDGCFYVDNREAPSHCLGDILEIKIIASEEVTQDQALASYRFYVNGTLNEYRLYVQVGQDLDKFLGITMHRPVWLWVGKDGITAEISHYAGIRSGRLKSDKRRRGDQPGI